MDISPEEHVDVQTTIQRWIDSSISKTVNAPKGYSVKQVEGIYQRLYDQGAKGGTVYVDGSRDSQVLSLTNEENNFEEVNEEESIKAESENSIGSKENDTCVFCKKGKLKNEAGCLTCTNCKMQSKCGW